MKYMIVTLILLSVSLPAWAEIHTEGPAEYVKTGKLGHNLVCSDMADTATATQARLKKKVRISLGHNELVEVSEPTISDKHSLICVTVKYNEVAKKSAHVDLFKQLQQANSSAF